MSFRLYFNLKLLLSMLACIIKRTMSQNTINKILCNAETAEKRLSELKNKLQELKSVEIEKKIKELTAENKTLDSKIKLAKAELIQLETAHGKKQYPIPGKDSSVTIETTSASNQTPSVTEQTPSTKVKESTKKVKEPKTKSAEPATAANIDVRKLDLRIGKIIEINKHPDADTLYVEKVDCGEDNPRTVVSGLVNHVPIEEMQNRMVMILANLKPVKMRGITSEAMVMCASSPDKVEVLTPPSGAAPGDLVHCEGFPREPEPVLNPKKKIFETCAPDLMTNNEKVACYKGSPLVVPGKGPILAPTLKGVSVK